MIFWIDKNGREYYKSEIDDKYLLNIVKSVLNGYYNSERIHEEEIDNIFEECYNRGLMSLEEAHENSQEAREKIYDDDYENDLYFYEP